jgi:acetylornithine deacetylase/succinyl-diaminopimelate desuccinylase-like protein
MAIKSGADFTFNKQQQSWYEQACDKIDQDRLKQLIVDLTARHSPTGAERAASEFMVDYMNAAGIEAKYQAITETSGNCVGRLRGSGSGPSLLLYAPIDTLLEGDPLKDLPHAGRTMRADMLPQPIVDGDLVIGLGASNPKSMVAMITEAAHCVLQAGIELTGDVIVATAAGGMPWVVAERGHAGISNGVSHMLSHGVAADFGIIVKPWDEVYYEHPGMIWFKVTTWGTMGYAGIPRGTPGFRSSIVPGAKVILEIEQWLIEYPDRHTSDQIKPEGWIAAVRSGWPEKPALPGAACEIFIDVRTAPGQTAAQVEREFSELMKSIMAKYDDVEAEWETIVTCDAARTDPEHWVTRSATRAWEAVHDRKYGEAPYLSGQTDAAAICRLGVPLVRIGYPWIGDKEMPAEYAEGLGGMGVANIPDLVGTIKALIYSVIDSCTRSRAEIDID